MFAKARQDTGSARHHGLAADLPVEGAMPSLDRDHLVDSPPLTRSGLQGSAVLVQFWTFGLTTDDVANTWAPYLTFAEAFKLAAQTFKRDAASSAAARHEDEMSGEPLIDLEAIVRGAAFRLLITNAAAIPPESLATITGIKGDRLAVVLDDLDRAGRIRRDEAGRVVGSAGLSVVPDRHEIADRRSSLLDMVRL